MECYSLEQAKKFKSKTKPYPFIIAHECNETYLDKSTGQQVPRIRKFFVFDDIESFLSSKSNFPHSHEVIFNRFTPFQQGRLVFDFDFDTPWAGINPHFVPKNFEASIELLVIETFKRFYINVDTDRFEFVWLISDTIDKWSKHLVVKNAFFSRDWKLQSQIFYNLMLGIAHEKETFTLETSALIDTQVARSNATMRILGCTKLGRDKSLRLENKSYHDDKQWDFNEYDTMVQLYRRQDMSSEQNISDINLRKTALDEMSDDKLLMVKNPYYKQSCQLSNFDVEEQTAYDSEALSEEKVNFAMQCLEEYHNLKSLKCPFQIRTINGAMIDLKRTNPEQCLVSGRVHDNENAYMIVYDNSILFYCRRGCMLRGNNYIYIYKN